ncbi:MAG: hypothetical protein HY811_01090 [Planctomycetes bacterium]|nr:hypothetical protein [Planctomycetota bacterium]
MGTQSDETLALSYGDGNDSAMDILVGRYYKPVWGVLINNSNYKDKSFIDDLIQITFFTICKLLKNDKFGPRYPGLPAEAPAQAGSFKNWIFDIAKKIAFTENRRYGHAEHGLDKEYLETFTEDPMARIPEPSSDNPQKEMMIKLMNQAINKLESLDRKLFLLKQNNSYAAILEYDEFRFNEKGEPNKSGQLRMRYCRILKSIRSEILWNLKKLNKD